MTHVDTLALVRRAELFRGLDEAVIEIIAAAGSRRAITRGTPLIQQGAPAAALYFVLDGRLKVVHGTPQGEQVTLRFMGPEELVGCAAVFRQMPYPASATAITPKSGTTLRAAARPITFFTTGSWMKPRAPPATR